MATGGSQWTSNAQPVEVIPRGPAVCVGEVNCTTESIPVGGRPARKLRQPQNSAAAHSGYDIRALGDLNSTRRNRACNYSPRAASIGSKTMASGGDSTRVELEGVKLNSRRWIMSCVQSSRIPTTVFLTGSRNDSISIVWVCSCGGTGSIAQGNIRLWSVRSDLFVWFSG